MKSIYRSELYYLPNRYDRPHHYQLSIWHIWIAGSRIVVSHKFVDGLFSFRLTGWRHSWLGGCTPHTILGTSSLSVRPQMCPMHSETRLVMLRRATFLSLIRYGRVHGRVHLKSADLMWDTCMVYMKLQNKNVVKSQSKSLTHTFYILKRIGPFSISSYGH